MLYANQAWFMIWYGFYIAFVFELNSRWQYELLPPGTWSLVRAPWFYFATPSQWDSTYPTDTDGYAERDVENWSRAMATFEAIRPIALPRILAGEDVWYDLWVMPAPGLPSRVVFRVDLFVDYFGEKVIIGQVLTLPFWFEGFGTVGQKSFWPYSAWQLTGMDQEARDAIFEIRDGLRPWTYGASLVPVPNDGHPGLLEIHRQLTNSEDLGIYHQPTLRDKVGEAGGGCGYETVFVKVLVTGTRLESGDLILPKGSPTWVYNHYGQVRVRRKIGGLSDHATAWKWMRSRNYTEHFVLPKKAPDTPPEAYTYEAEFQNYAGLTVTALVVPPVP